MTQALLIIFSYSLLAILLSWLYFRSYAVKRLPISVFNLWDVVAMLSGILLVPYLYLALPTWLVIGLLGLAGSNAIYVCLEPILPQSRLLRLVILLLAAGNLVLHCWFGPTSGAFFALNNGMQVIAVVGITNFWAQSGLKARDAAILGGVLIIYDYVFTSILPLMNDLFKHLQGVPFAPLVAWPLSDGQWATIGLGDLLLATVFPLVIRKAYGRRAGLLALGLALAVIGGLMLWPALGWQPVVFPVMIVLGPLMGMQFGYWRWRRGTERTTYQYLQAEPLLTP